MTDKLGRRGLHNYISASEERLQISADLHAIVDTSNSVSSVNVVKILIYYKTSATSFAIISLYCGNFKNIMRFSVALNLSTK